MIKTENIGTEEKIMKAVLIKTNDRLEIGEVPMPDPNADDLLVQVKATAINRADILQRKGLYPPPKGESPVMGLEMSGIITKVGKNCTNWKEGDRVFGLLAGGGYTQYVKLHYKMAIKIPENLSFEEAAAIPETFLTAYQAIFWLGELQKGEIILIHAGASGVGTAAIQLCREIGAKIFVTAGSDDKLKTCAELGASLTWNYKKGSFLPAVLEASEKEGVDLILDFIGKPYFEDNISALAIDGRIIFLALMGGNQIQNFNLRNLMSKRIRLIGSTLRNRSFEYKINLTREFTEFALPRFASGKLKPVIDKIYSWEKVKEAHDYMEANKNTGKIVLKIS
jgi:putative PIG3 family NAD(P)H quinone oxidoreductase